MRDPQELIGKTLEGFNVSATACVLRFSDGWEAMFRRSRHGNTIVHEVSAPPVESTRYMASTTLRGDIAIERAFDTESERNAWVEEINAGQAQEPTWMLKSIRVRQPK